MSRSELILGYWFGTSSDPAVVFKTQSAKWFNGGKAVDNEIREHFMDDVRGALEGELDDWLDAPRSCMALVILLDQFTRNVYRGTPRAFSGDPDALGAAEHAIKAGYEADLEFHHRVFLYVPFEHSESLAVQDRGVQHFDRLVVDSGPHLETATTYRNYATAHRDIVARFGRFPHRNGILARDSTAEEVAFLKTPGSSF